VAFIGSTGSGKSTLVNLIPRFYDVTEGEILVDGVNVQDYQLEDLHNKVGYIPQKAVLFSGDIENNLDFGQSKESPLDEQKMWDALDLAQAKPFVQEKEKGLKSEVAQSGTNFSGGQRQRLAIARALARKPEILIFDDSFSALDYKTDRILRKELAERTQDMTKLIVAQRISTIMDADQILVLDAGKVVGQGTHRELLASNEVYQEIAYSQLSKEELENGK
jgi:ABC-type multidrug transport system, ATPase and permease components, putative